MTFEACIECVLEIEKGYVFDSNDPGGETNWGISKRQYPHLDIKNLTRAEAINIYFQDYWTPLKPLEVPPRLRLALLDAAVHHGVKQAIKLFQGAVGVQQDGVIGPQTLTAAKAKIESNALSNMLQLRLAFMGKLPHWGNYSKGWSKRLLLIAIWSFK